MKPKTLFRFFFYSILLSFMAGTALQIRTLNRIEYGTPFIRPGSFARFGRVIYTRGDYQSISNAVSRANPGDTIQINPGWYDITNEIVIPSGVSIRGSRDKKGEYATKFRVFNSDLSSPGFHFESPIGDRSYCAMEAFPKVIPIVVADLYFDYSYATNFLFGVGRNIRCTEGSSPHTHEDDSNLTHDPIWTKVGQRSWYQSATIGGREDTYVPLAFGLQYYRSRFSYQQAEGIHGYDSEADFIENTTVAPLHGIIP